ncbi:hypothetical protein BLA29_008584 [Euroglyphus maynei]|uniref:Uncharacterized protein n=1 Tax=Euroglyphus maynei TaxID=6958 RepID=A0A1Y3AU11_EURMA|nr:hypothetical protein BLA29_008584 [Euroglyphus maynei]
MIKNPVHSNFFIQKSVEQFTMMPPPSYDDVVDGNKKYFSVHFPFVVVVVVVRIKSFRANYQKKL